MTPPIYRSHVFLTMLAGLLAFVAKFFVPSFPLDTEAILAIVLFLIGGVSTFHLVRNQGVAGATIGDLLHSLAFWEMLTGAIWFAIHYYAPQFPFDSQAVLALFIFVLAYFKIYPEFQLRGLMQGEQGFALPTFQQGNWRVKPTRLNVRTTPSSENSNNFAGFALTIGKVFPVYKVVYDKNSWAWALITPEEQLTSHYVCLYNFNTLFADYVGPLAAAPTPGTSPFSRDIWMKNVHEKEGYPFPPPF